LVVGLLGSALAPAGAWVDWSPQGQLGVNSYVTTVNGGTYSIKAAAYSVTFVDDGLITDTAKAVNGHWVVAGSRVSGTANLIYRINVQGYADFDTNGWDLNSITVSVPFGVGFTVNQATRRCSSIAATTSPQQFRSSDRSHSVSTQPDKVYCQVQVNTFFTGSSLDAVKIGLTGSVALITGRGGSGDQQITVSRYRDLG
jgi:hypothetical protein